MKKKKKITPNKGPLWVLGLTVLAILIIWLILPQNNSNEKEIETNVINFSSQEYKDLDFDKENITFEARDQKGELITGKEWFGVNGVYFQEKPLIFGENEYSYWVENDSYIVFPEILIPDVYHTKQSIVASAFKIENLTKNFRVLNQNYEEEFSWKPWDEDYEISEMRIDYHSSKYSKFPLGGVLIFEYDKNIQKINCNEVEKGIPEYWTQGVYYMQNFNSRVTSFFLQPDEGDYERVTLECRMKKLKHLKIENNKILISFYPMNYYLENYYLDEGFDIMVGVEDYYMNMKTKKVLEKEIILK